MTRLLTSIISKEVAEGIAYLSSPCKVTSPPTIVSDELYVNGPSIAAVGTFIVTFCVRDKSIRVLMLLLILTVSG